MKVLLAIPHFPRLLIAWTVGNFADSALFLTLAIWAKDLTGSSGAAGLVFFCLGAPVIASPLFGLLADRVRRRPLLVASNLIAAVSVLALVLVRSPAQLWLIYLVTVIYGALGCVYGAARSGLLRSMLPDDLLGEANSAFMTIDQGLRILTPLAGAALYAIWGGPTLAVAVAVLLAVSALGIAAVKVDESGALDRPDDDIGWRAMSAGFAHLRRVRELLILTIGLAVALSAIGFYDSLVFAVIEHRFHKPPEFFGVLMSVQGAGSIIGGITAARVLRRLGATRAVAAALGAFAATSVAFFFGPIWLGFAALVVWGAAIPWAFVAFATTRQRLTPDRLQGRVSAASDMGLVLPQMIGTATGAGLVELIDYRTLGAMVIVVIALAAWWTYRQRHVGSAAQQTVVTEA